MALLGQDRGGCRIRSSERVSTPFCGVSIRKSDVHASGLLTRRCLLIALLWALPASLFGQAPNPEVSSGGVVTFFVSFEVPAGLSDGQLPSAYSVEPTEGVQVLGDAEGSLDWLEAGAAGFPLTLSVPNTLRAGLRQVAVVMLEWSEGIETESVVSIQVLQTFQIEGGIDMPTTSGGLGSTLKIPFHIENHGNATDSINVILRGPGGWQISDPLRSVTLEPGEVHRGTISIKLPQEAAASLGRLGFEAEGLGNRVFSGADIVLESRQGWLPGVRHLPATVFVGGSATAFGASSVGFGQDRLDIRARGAGELGEETFFSVQYQNRNFGRGAVNARGLTVGPDFLAELRHGVWLAEVGDVFLPNGLVTARNESMEGGSVRYDDGRYFGHGYAGFGRNFGGGLDFSDYFSSGEFGIRTGFGALSFRSQVSRFNPERGLGEGGVETALVRHTLGGRNTPFTLESEVGLARLTNSSFGSRTGPVVSTRARYFTPALSGTLEIIEVPGTGTQTGFFRDQILGLARFRVTPWLFLTTSGNRQVIPIESSLGDREFLAGSGGMDLRLGQFTVGATGTLREQRLNADPDSVVSTQRSGTLRSSFGVGAVDFLMTVQRGRTTVDDGERTFTTASATARMVGVRTSFNLGGRFTERTGSGKLYRFFGDGYTQMGSFFYQGRINAGWSSQEFFSGFSWGHESSLGLTLRPDLRLYGNVRYDRFSQGSSTMTLGTGVEIGFDLPVPIPQPGRRSGIVFHDRNGDGVRGSGEIGIPGVSVFLSGIEAVTDRDGLYEVPRIADANGLGFAQVDPTTLPDGLVPMTRLRRQEEDGLDIPVSSSAAVSVRVFEDQDADGARSDNETVMGGVIVNLIDEDGLEIRSLVSSEGVAFFRDIVPGRLRILVEGDDGNPLNGSAAASDWFTLFPAEEAVKDFGVIPFGRPVVFGRVDEAIAEPPESVRSEPPPNPTILPEVARPDSVVEQAPDPVFGSSASVPEAESSALPATDVRLGSVTVEAFVDLDGDGIRSENDSTGVGQVRVVLRDESGREFRAPVDPEGRHTFERMEPGRYELHFTSVIEPSRWVGNRTTIFRLPEGGEVRKLEVIEPAGLDSAEGVDRRVFSPASPAGIGEPLDTGMVGFGGVEIQVYMRSTDRPSSPGAGAPAAGVAVLLENGRGQEWFGVTSDDGSLSFDHLPAGRYRLRLGPDARSGSEPSTERIFRIYPRSLARKVEWLDSSAGF